MLTGTGTTVASNNQLLQTESKRSWRVRTWFQVSEILYTGADEHGLLQEDLIHSKISPKELCCYSAPFSLPAVSFRALLSVYTTVT